MMITEINVARPQCPVGLNTLMLPTKSAAIASDRQPYVYISCGHVHGQHSWGRDSNDNTRTCPMCMMVRRCIFVTITILRGKSVALYATYLMVCYCVYSTDHLSNCCRAWKRACVLTRMLPRTVLDRVDTWRLKQQSGTVCMLPHNQSAVVQLKCGWVFHVSQYMMLLVQVLDQHTHSSRLPGLQSGVSVLCGASYGQSWIRKAHLSRSR